LDKITPPSAAYAEGIPSRQATAIIHHKAAGLERQRGMGEREVEPKARST